VEARLLAIKTLVNWLAYGQRVGGENRVVPLELPSVLNQEVYGRLVLLGSTAELVRNDLRSAHQDLVAEDARLAQATPRQSFADHAREDADTITQADIETTENAMNLEFPDPKMRSLRIAITRATAIKYLCEELLNDDKVRPATRSLDTEGLLLENNKQMLSDAADRFDDCITDLVSANRQLMEDYEKYADIQSWGSFEGVTTLGGELTQSADIRVMEKCAGWTVE
jgi:hypothetical protein